MESGSIHFTLGENFGRLLTEIAIEKLYNLNISGALDIFDSLGCGPEISKKLLLGDYILVVSDGNNCECMAIPSESYSGDPYPTINFKILQNKILELLVDKNEIKLAKIRIESNGLFEITRGEIFLRYKKLIESILNNDEDILDLINTEEPGEDFESFYKTIELFRKINSIVSKRCEIIKIAEFIEDNYKFHIDNLKKEVEDNINTVLDFLMIDMADI